MARRPIKTETPLIEEANDDFPPALKVEMEENDVIEDEDDGDSIFADGDEPASEKDGVLSILGKTAKAWSSFRPASQVLTAVKAVPTIFPGLDWATKVGGIPIERFTLVHGPSGEGKALASYTRVLTPGGWVEIGQLRVGDTVIAGDGSSTEVEGVYPQGKLQLFKVTFDDNTSVECCKEHLWFTTTIQERNRGRYIRGSRPERARIPTGQVGEGSVKSLEEIMENNFVPRDHAIPLTGPVQFEALGDLPLDPYLLGLYLGDGSSLGSQPRFYKPEEDLQREFVSLLPEGDEAKLLPDGIRINGGGLLRHLKHLGLHGLRSWEKFIPEIYKRASIDDRMALLRGLCDTDGSVVKDGGAVEYSTSSFQLAEDFVELARSLGAYVTREKRITEFSYKGEVKKGRPSERIRVYFNDDRVPVSSEKNLKKWVGRGERTQYRSIVSIEPSKVYEAVCIKVAHPSALFVVKDFIVTHNTKLTIGLLLSFLMRNHLACLIDAERCYDAETEVLTRRGFVLWPHVREDDQIGCWDPALQSLVYEKPFELTRQSYKGPMRRIDHGGVDLLVTPKHKMYVRTKIDRGSRVRGEREIGWNEWALVPADELGDRMEVKYRKHATRTEALPFDASRFPEHDDRLAFLRLIGFFIGDGWVGKKRGRTNGVCFGLTKPRKVAYLRELAEELGWPCKEMSNRVYVLEAEGVGRIFRAEFYDENDEKCIPEYLLDLNQEEAEALLDGLRNSDGSSKRGAWEYYSTSDQVAAAVQRLVIHAGGAAHINRTEAIGMNRVMVLSRMIEPVINTGHAGRNTSLVDYDGEIFCAHTRTGIMMIRRKGKPVLSGNTTPITWLHAAMGKYAHSDGFFASRPKTYEATVQYVREMLNTLRKLRDGGKLPNDTSMLIVVDSIRKLVPEDIFKRIMAGAKAAEEALGGKSGSGKGTNRHKKPERVGRDRGSMIKAQMNSAWMDELIPLLEEAQAGMVVIARETMDPEADQQAKMWGNDYKVGGGSALYYDASLVMRVERQRLITKERSDEEKDSGVKAVVYGERHRVTVRKSKVSGKEDAQTQWYFHDSNGTLIPVGFDRARDLLELGMKFGLVKTKASWRMWNGNKWQGDHRAVQKLTANVDLLGRFEEAVRGKFNTIQPLEFNSDGVVIGGQIG